MRVWNSRIFAKWKFQYPPAVADSMSEVDESMYVSELAEALAVTPTPAITAQAQAGEGSQLLEVDAKGAVTSTPAPTEQTSGLLPGEFVPEDTEPENKEKDSQLLQTKLENFLKTQLNNQKKLGNNFLKSLNQLQKLFKPHQNQVIRLFTYLLSSQTQINLYTKLKMQCKNNKKVQNRLMKH